LSQISINECSFAVFKTALENDISDFVQADDIFVKDVVWTFVRIKCLSVPEHICSRTRCDMDCSNRAIVIIWISLERSEPRISYWVVERVRHIVEYNLHLGDWYWTE